MRKTTMVLVAALVALASCSKNKNEGSKYSCNCTYALLSTPKNTQTNYYEFKDMSFDEANAKCQERQKYYQASPHTGGKCTIK